MICSVFGTVKTTVAPLTPVLVVIATCKYVENCQIFEMISIIIIIIIIYYFHAGYVQLYTWNKPCF